jgi:hypothetical protein
MPTLFITSRSTNLFLISSMIVYYFIVITDITKRGHGVHAGFISHYGYFQPSNDNSFERTILYHHFFLILGVELLFLLSAVNAP